MEQLNGTVTDAGAAYINQQIVAGQPVTIDHFMLAYVPGIDETTPADPAITAVPATATFSQSEPIHKLAYNGDNAVTYSLMLAASAGDFDFNWYGIVTDTGVLLAFAHIPEVKKRANIGQVINRNFVVPFTNAKALTGAQVPVESWQFDNTIHLNRIDADVRAVNREMYGHATFFADAGLVTASGADYHVATGNAVIGGIQITVPETTLPAAEGDFIQCAVTWAVDNQGNYSADVTLFADPVEAVPVAGNVYSATLASVGAAQAVTDLREVRLQVKEALEPATETKHGPVMIASASDVRQMTGEKSVKASQLGMLPYGRKNLIINGCFRFWDYSENVTLPKVGGYLAANRFYFYNTDHSSCSIRKSSESPAGFSNSIFLNYAPDTLGVNWNIQQRVEIKGQEWIGEVGRKFVFSFYAKSPVGSNNEYGIVLEWRGGSGANVPVCARVNVKPVGNGWERIVVPFEVAETFTDHTFLSVQIAGYEGDSPNITKAGIDTYLTGIQLEPGEVATDFEYRHIGEELALCQRYYFKVTNWMNMSSAVSYDGVYRRHLLNFVFPSSMRSIPTVTIGEVSNGGSGTNHSVTEVSNKMDITYMSNTSSYFTLVEYLLTQSTLTGHIMLKNIGFDAEL